MLKKKAAEDLKGNIKGAVITLHCRKDLQPFYIGRGFEIGKPYFHTWTEKNLFLMGKAVGVPNYGPRNK